MTSQQIAAQLRQTGGGAVPREALNAAEQIAALQAQLAAAQAQLARKDRKYSWKETDKGQIHVSGPGMAFGACLDVNVVRAMIDDATLRAAVTGPKGDAILAARAAYRQTPEYKASAERAYDQASAAKKAG